VPNTDDIAHCRVRTTRVTETLVKTRDYLLRFIDVGDQKSERRNWISLFQDVNSILFLVNLSGYDQCLIEDRDAVCSKCSHKTHFAHEPAVEPNAGCYVDMARHM